MENLTLKKIMRFYGKFNFDQISIKTELQVILDKQVLQIHYNKAITAEVIL